MSATKEERVTNLVHASGKVLRFPSRQEAERFLGATKDNERDEWILEGEEDADAAPKAEPLQARQPGTEDKG